jgi:hypothetical protein
VLLKKAAQGEVENNIRGGIYQHVFRDAQVEESVLAEADCSSRDQLDGAAVNPFVPPEGGVASA